MNLNFYFRQIKQESLLVAQTTKNLPAMQETWLQSLGQEDPLDKGMATPSSVLAWRIPWTEGPGGLKSLGGKELDMTEWIPLSFKQESHLLKPWNLIIGIRQSTSKYIFYCLIRFIIFWHVKTNIFQEELHKIHHYVLKAHKWPSVFPEDCFSLKFGLNFQLILSVLLAPIIPILRCGDSTLMPVHCRGFD